MIRKKEESTTFELLTDNSIIDTVVSYFDRRTDHDNINQAIKTRYGLGIKTNTNAKTGQPLEVYSKESVDTKVDSGMIESICLGFGHKVTSALANLFSEKGLSFSLVHDTKTAEELEEASLLWQNSRVDGGFDAAIVEADERSIQTGSCAIMIEYNNGALKYNTFPPSAVKFVSPASIVDAETKERRAPDNADIEDCYAVILRLGAAGVGEYDYLAIMGRSFEYPQGRYFQFRKLSFDSKIPEVGDDSVMYEYEIDNKPANPLSVLANQFPELSIPEYPITVIKGLVSDKSTPMPWSTSLYKDCLELDVAASHDLGASQEACRGVDVLSVDATGVGQPLPRTLSGQTVLNHGQTLEHISKNAEDAESAYDTLRKLAVDIAFGYSVPDYMVTSEDHALEASSGVALEVKTKPLAKERNVRIKSNNLAVKKIFEIEKNLIAAHSESDPALIQTLVECIQLWQPGQITLPENKKEAMERIVSAMKNGILDTVGAIREYYQLGTDVEAIAMYKTLQERTKEYPSLAIEEKPKPKFGLNKKGEK